MTVFRISSNLSGLCEIMKLDPLSLLISSPALRDALAIK